MSVEIQVILPPRSQDPLSDMLRYITQEIAEKTGEQTGWGLGGEHGYGEPWDSPVFTMRRFYWDDCDCGWEQTEEDWCAKHKHSDECYQGDLKREEIAAGGVLTECGFVSKPDAMHYRHWDKLKNDIYDKLCVKYGLNRRFGCAVHCTCGHQEEWEAFAKANGHKPTCSLELPNFRHHASGFEVRWYKYIGRDNQTVNQPADLTPIFNDCLRDIASADTRPKGGDSTEIEAPFTSGAVGEAETPNLQNQPSEHERRGS